MNAVISLRFRPRPVPPYVMESLKVGLCWRATARGSRIGANLPKLGFDRPVFWRFTQVALMAACNVCRPGFGGNRVDERRDDQAQQAPNAGFSAAARRGESPRWSAMSGSANSASKRLQTMCAFALL